MKHKKVKEPFNKFRQISPNKSSRSTGISLIVLHDTESHDYIGTQDLRGVASWFANTGSQVSAHIIVDSQGYSARCVEDKDKAWHCMAFNSASLGVEQIGYSTFTRSLWLRGKRRQLKKVAKYLAYWSKKYDIPLKRAVVNRINGNVVSAGITTHSALGVAGGNHGDPGKGYPFRLVLFLARRYRKHGW